MARALPYIGAVIGGLYTWNLQGVQYGYMIGSCFHPGVKAISADSAQTGNPTIDDLQARVKDDHLERSH